MNQPDFLPRMDRRVAIKWMLTAAASLSSLPLTTRAATKPASIGYGPDPDVLKTYAPGDIWPLTLTPAQRQTVTALSDIIIPADTLSPAASTVGITDFIDEWVSAPYPGQVQDRQTVTTGLGELDAQAQSVGVSTFVDLPLSDQQLICRKLAVAAKSESASPSARFFKRFRDLVAGGYYTSPVGMKDLGYVGNVPLAAFPGPTPEALRHLGLA